MSGSHTFRVVFVWVAVGMRFPWFRAVLEARNHRFAARTGHGCTCGEYERGLRLERRPQPCPYRKWHREQARAYLRDCRTYRRWMRAGGPSWPRPAGVSLETQAEWMAQGGPPWLALNEPIREVA